MSKNFVPSRESDLVAFSRNMSVLINADPLIYGLDVKQGTNFQALFDAFDALFIACNDPGTRTPTAIQNKKTAKTALIAEIRRLAAIIQAYPGTTDGMRRDLNLTVRDYEPTPVPVPAESPVMTVTSVSGRLFNLELRQVGSDSRAKPDGVRAAWIYTAFGDEQPTTFEVFQFRGEARKTDTQIVMPESVAPGTKVWVSACWVNTAGKPGPVSMPIATWTTHGTMKNSAA